LIITGKKTNLTEMFRERIFKHLGIVYFLCHGGTVNQLQSAKYREIENGNSCRMENSLTFYKIILLNG